MRITNNMMADNSVWYMNQNLERLSKAQQQVSTQSKIQLPSDDPVVATRAVKYRHYVAKIEQYQKNAEDAASWQKVTDSALGDLSDVMQRVQELTVQASSDSLTDNDKEDIKAEISQLKEQVVQVMNTTYAGRYIFGGYSSDTAPYSIESTSVGDKVKFKGAYLSLGGPMSASAADADIISSCQSYAAQMYQDGADESISYQVGFGSQVTVNVEGQDVIGAESGANLFDTLDKLLLGLEGETSYKTATIDTTTSPATVTVTTETLAMDQLLTDLDSDFERLQNARAGLGARMNYVATMKTRLSNDNTTYTTLMSNNEDIDVAEATIELATAQTVYEAALSVGAKVLTHSLLDYLS